MEKFDTSGAGTAYPSGAPEFFCVLQYTNNMICWIQHKTKKVGFLLLDL